MKAAFKTLKAHPKDLLVFLRRDNLTALIDAGLQVNMVRTAQLARVLVFNKGVGTERMVRTTHVAP